MKAMVPRPITTIINIALLQGNYESSSKFQTMNKYVEQFKLDLKQKIAFESIYSSLCSKLSDRSEGVYGPREDNPFLSIATEQCFIQ